MAVTNLFTGDTVRVKASFYNWAPEGQQGTAIDPDGSAASVTVYDCDLNQIETGSASREAVGVYYYDWTVPATEGIYYVEFSANFNAMPQLSRKTFLAQFRP